jgi:hypothetical protein
MESLRLARVLERKQNLRIYSGHEKRLRVATNGLKQVLREKKLML